MLAPAELDSLRASARATMVDTATIKRHAAVSDLMGGITHTWAAIGTEPCRIAGASSGGGVRGEDEVAQRFAAVASWIVTMPYDASVRVDDRLEINGKTLEVKGVLGGTTDRITLRVAAEDVT